MQSIRLKRSFTNEELVTGIAENDRSALNYLYSQNYPAVKHYVLKNSGDEEEARDIFQEAIIATWMNIRAEKFQLLNGTSVGGYIYQIARNKWLDKIRSKPYRNTMRLDHEEIDQERYSDFDESVDVNSKIRYLKSLYGNLGEKCRQILNRFYYAKKSLQEIGLELNHDPDTVRTMKYRCMMKLRKMHCENETLKMKQS